MHRPASFRVFGLSTALGVAALSGGFPVAGGLLGAQDTRLTISTTSVAIATPVAADYSAGWKASATGMTFTIDALSGGSRTAKVLVRAGCSDLGAGKALGDLQWRRSDLGTWTSITQSDVLVEQRVMTTNGANDPWSNTLFFRMLLNWVNDEPNPYQCDIKVTLTQTVP